MQRETVMRCNCYNAMECYNAMGCIATRYIPMQEKTTRRLRCSAVSHLVHEMTTNTQISFVFVNHLCIWLTASTAVMHRGSAFLERMQCMQSSADTLLNTLTPQFFRRGCMKGSAFLYLDWIDIATRYLGCSAASLASFVRFIPNQCCILCST